jgi:transcriptional regulator with XRE-family HTH domain
MDEKGVSINELAERANIATNTARTLYHGINTRVDLPLIARIANALGVPPKDLLEEYDEPEMRGYNDELMTPALGRAA